MYGLKDPDTGRVGPFNKGAMFGSIEVFLFILSIGGFMSVVFSTGALDRGIHHLSYRFRERGALLIAILTLLFGALGSIKGWSDESLGFFAMMMHGTTRPAFDQSLRGRTRRAGARACRTVCLRQHDH